MAKKGGSRHSVRIGAKKSLGIKGRKTIKWLCNSLPGAHKKSESVPIGVMLRDILKIANSMSEAKSILNSGNIIVNGNVVREERLPVGLMDIIENKSSKKTYRVEYSGVNLLPKEIKGEGAKAKYAKVIGKHTVKKGKICLTFHDGRNYIGDSHINPGDTCVFSIPDFKLVSHFKLEPGVKCIVVDGKHRGAIAKLEKIIERPGSHETEAELSFESGNFITVAKYLFVVDEKFSS